MGVNVRERTIEEIEKKLKEMNTDLNKISYIESALKVAGSNFEIKRFLWGEIGRLYEGRKMYERAAKAYFNKAGMEVLSKDKIDSYVNSAELYSKLGKVDEADDVFLRAAREATDVNQKTRVKLARKNIYTSLAKEFESKGKHAGAMKFYEKIYKMNLEESEKMIIREKLKKTYTSLGMFREAKML